MFVIKIYKLCGMTKNYESAENCIPRNNTSNLSKARVTRDSSGPATVAISVCLYSNKILMHLEKYLNLRPPYGGLLEFKRSKLRFLATYVLC